MRTFEYVFFEIASSSQQPLCSFGDKIRFLMCVFTVILKNVNYRLEIIIRFRH